MTKFLSVLAALLIGVAAFAQNPEDSFDYSVIASQKHPRLFINDADFKALKKDIASGRIGNVSRMHELLLAAADDYVSKENTIVYKLDKAGRRLGDCGAMSIITSCSYAYRYTGDKKYLAVAEKAINDLCDFKDWMPSHYLGTSRIAFDIAFGYDWLYKKLSPSTKKKVVESLREKAFEPSRDRKCGSWYGWLHNWNQVCNSGLVCAAIATYESNPEESAALIKKAVTTNRKTVVAVYSPDGASPEGPGYWGYGTSRQVWLNMMLEYNLGTDFGLSEVPGFEMSGDYIVHMRGNTGKYFNYSDNGEKSGSIPSLWYFAARFGKPWLLFDEVKRIGAYKKNEFPIMMLVNARKLGNFTPEPPSSNFFVAHGENPVATFRTGWSGNDLFLGVKAGTAYANHGHMDVGEFVFDADGIRWAKDAVHTSYARLEVPLKKLHQGLFNRNQTALRWQMLQFNNRYHNTLTVNDHDHLVKGQSDIVEVWNDASAMGAALEFAGVFHGDVKAARRTCRIMEGSYLEVIDEITAPEGAPALVRWNMLTEARPEISSEGIVLDIKDRKMLLSASGAALTYKTWSTNPKDYSGPTREFEPWFEKDHLVGFEFEVPAGASVKVVTTLKRQ